MMYMEDAVGETIKLMEADPEKLTIRTSYNIHAMDFTPSQIYEEVKRYKPDLEIQYKPDSRQKIAESWPQVFVHEKARQDWGFNPKFGITEMVADILKHSTPEFIRQIRPK